LIGFTGFFLRTVRGNGLQSSVFIGYQPMEGDIKSAHTGVLVAWEPGVAVTYGLLNAQGRGDTFIDPGTPVYEGMIVGMHRREGDIPINVCKEKKLTNMRSSTADITRRLNATVRMSLDEALDFIASDELVEVTPQSYRMRKKELSTAGRSRHRATSARERAGSV
jgi:GTP-binding protein